MGKLGYREPCCTCICVWCGEHFETAVESAQTCGAKCRQRLKRYRDWTGMDPEEPPGQMGVKEAVAEMVQQLLAAERKRRMYRAWENDQAAKKCVERSRQIAEANEKKAMAIEEMQRNA